MKARLGVLGVALLLSGCWSGGVAVDPLPGSTAGSALDLACPGGALKAEGASSQKSAIELLVQHYVAACPGTTVDYTASGSGAGIKAFIGSTVDWAGSDSPLRTVVKDGVVESEQAASRCQGNPAWNLPMIFGPIAVAYNLEGIDQLNLTAPLLARIFSGEITSWDDPDIAAANPGVQLPSQRIAVFFRADESGTTENFTHFLSEAAAEHWSWDPAKKWPAARGEGKEKTAGVADTVATTPGAIGYLEWGAAQERELTVISLDGVALTGENASAAIAEAEFAATGHDLALTIDAEPEGEAYPLVQVTYEIVCSAGGSNTALVQDFLKFMAADSSQELVASLGYAPLPETLQQRVVDAIEAMS